MNVLDKRARRVLRTPLIAILLVMLGGTAIASAARSALGSHHATQSRALVARLSNVSTHATGSPVALTAADQTFLASFAQGGEQLTTASMLGVRGGRAIYEISNSTGPDCYAVGPMQPASYTLGQVGCTAGFPSATSPIADFTVVNGGISSTPAAHVFRAEGVAADGVAAVGFRTADDRLVGVTPVVHNIYESTAPPKDVVTQLVALDASNAVIWSEDVGQ
jgi:hypothetical protein